MRPSTTGTIVSNEVRPPPAFVAAGGGRDRARDERSEEQTHRLREPVHASTTRARPWIGYVSVSSDPNTGTEYAWPKPTPTREQKSWNGFTTRPFSAIARPQPIVAIQTMRTRDTRSASQASGTAPSTSATPPNAVTPMSVVSLMCSVRWMSGASTPPAARSRFSATVISASMITIAEPPACSVSRRLICSSPTPGSRSSGRIVTAERAACSS